MLIERDELTSGSTWHAAGGMHTFNGDPSVAKLQEYTINSCVFVRGDHHRVITSERDDLRSFVLNLS